MDTIRFGIIGLAAWVLITPLTWKSSDTPI